MRTTHVLAVSVVVGSAAAVAVGVPVSAFTESFDTDASGWVDGASGALGYDAGGFVSAGTDLNDAHAQFGSIVFRGHAALGASGGAFAGDWLTGGMDTLSFDIRHDFSDDLNFAVRLAGPANAPAFILASPVMVAAGDWTTLSFTLDPNSPFYIPEGPPGFGFFAGVASNIGNVQMLVMRPAGVTGPTPITLDMDNVSVSPTPGGVAVLAISGLVATRRRR